MGRRRAWRACTTTTSADASTGQEERGEHDSHRIPNGYGYTVRRFRAAPATWQVLVPGAQPRMADASSTSTITGRAKRRLAHSAARVPSVRTRAGFRVPGGGPENLPCAGALRRPGRPVAP